MNAWEDVKAEFDALVVKIDAYIDSHGDTGNGTSPSDVELLAFRDAIKTVADRVPPTG